jgi:hypothetical protein
MWSFVFRLALLASTIIVMLNFARAWIAVLRGPKRHPEVAAESHAEIAARIMAGEATRHVTAIEVAVAGLADADLWHATEAFSGAVNALKAAMLAEPDHYRRAKRHLGQILIAAEQTTRHFARHYGATPNPGTRRQFMELLEALTEAYGRATEHYASAGATELELEAETLKELLKRNRL